MKISHPRFVNPESHEEELTPGFPDCLKKGPEQNTVQRETSRTSVFAFPKVSGEPFLQASKLNVHVRLF